MDIIPHIQEAFSNLRASKLRSFLAILGILVGTASVVAMVSCGELATEAALAQFKALGTNLLSVALYDEGGGGAGGGGDQNNQMNLQAVNDLKKASDDITLIAPYTSIYLPISYNGKTLNGSIIGATGTLQPAIKIQMPRGRFITFLDTNVYYCIIGQGLYQQIKQTTIVDPVLHQIQLGNSIFTIIGVADQWQENSFFNEDINNAVIIPIQSAQVLSKFAAVRNIVIRLREGADIDKVQGVINGYINQTYPGKKIFIRSAKQIVQSMQNQQQIYTILLGLIGSISLIVGGIGVMNIMLVSVVERKREIGIRMALGSRRKDIRFLFLVEAVTLSIFGGAMGVMLGLITSYIIAHFAGWQFMIFFIPPAIGFGVSVATGIFFGFYPAYQAAQLDPIQALRSE